MEAETKVCTKCKRELPKAEFSKSSVTKDGLRCWCKGCAAADAKSPVSRARQKAYRQSTKGRTYAKAYKQSPEGRVSIAKYRASAKGRANGRRKAARRRVISPEKARAGEAVGYAVRSGRLPSVRSQLCESCGEPAQHRHHYLGYSPEHWLDVIPLCRPCHEKAHHCEET